jgi:hypothetical protein
MRRNCSDNRSHLNLLGPVTQAPAAIPIIMHRLTVGNRYEPVIGLDKALTSQEKRHLPKGPHEHVDAHSDARFRIPGGRSFVPIDLSADPIDHICRTLGRRWHHGPRVFLREFTADDALTAGPSKAAHLASIGRVWGPPNDPLDGTLAVEACEAEGADRRRRGGTRHVIPTEMPHSPLPGDNRRDCLGKRRSFVLLPRYIFACNETRELDPKRVIGTPDHAALSDIIPSNLEHEFVGDGGSVGWR